GLGGQSPTNPNANNLRSLDRLSEFDSYLAAPGHGQRFRGLARRAQKLASHHRHRSQEVGAAMPMSDTVWEIATRIRWSDGFENLQGYKLGSALSQVSMHMQYVRGGGAEQARDGVKHRPAPPRLGLLAYHADAPGIRA